MPAKAETPRSAQEINTARRMGRGLITFGAAAATIAGVSACAGIPEAPEAKKVNNFAALGSTSAAVLGVALLAAARQEEAAAARSLRPLREFDNFSFNI